MLSRYYDTAHTLLSNPRLKQTPSGVTKVIRQGIRCFSATRTIWFRYCSRRLWATGELLWEHRRHPLAPPVCFPAAARPVTVGKFLHVSSKTRDLGHDPSVETADH